MSNQTFEKEWSNKVSKVRASGFWQQVSSPPKGRIVRATARPRKNEVSLDSSWALVVEGELLPDGPGSVGINDLRHFLKSRLALSLKASPGTSGPLLTLRLAPPPEPVSRWECSFRLDVMPDRITVTAPSENALLRACLYLSNYWSLRRNPYLTVGRRTIRPSVPLHIGADLWGGFCTTNAWIHGRETDENFLELARMGINAVPIMIVLEDYLSDVPAPFAALENPEAKKNRQRLGKLARQAARFGIRILCMGYNPKLVPNHPVFSRYPGCKGALQSGGKHRTLCTSDPKTRDYLASAWASLFSEIPELGGVIAIVGGEGFYHCFMRSQDNASDCPRCGRRKGSHVVAEFVNHVARRIHRECPEAHVLTWPYSAGHWSHDHDQAEYVARLDPKHVIFQTEIDKDSVDWREAGYGKRIWDYSISNVRISERCRRQRKICRERGLRFSSKIECSNSIECLNVPYLPALENQRALWSNARSLRPFSIHSRWLFDGSCKSPSEELGYWMIWGKGTEFNQPDDILTAIAKRDFGVEATKGVRKAWALFSEGLRHHPMLDYYIGSYFIGPCQPLVLNPDVQQSDLDPAFYGVFYWLWEDSATEDGSIMVERKPLFYRRPGFRAIARRGPNRGQDVALDELKVLADYWERGVQRLESVRSVVPSQCRSRFRQELTLARHLGLTWRSAANVEEFLRLRDTVREFSGTYTLRAGHSRENKRDLARMGELARHELKIAKQDLKLVKKVEFLDLSLRLDMGTASTERMLLAKIEQVGRLIKSDLPSWREELMTW